jgi:hypothetical protein
MTKAQYLKCMDLTLAQTKEIERLRIALRQARFYIRELGPQGRDKDYTIAFVDAALDRTAFPPATATIEVRTDDIQRRTQ